MKLKNLPEPAAAEEDDLADLGEFDGDGEDELASFEELDAAVEIVDEEDADEAKGDEDASEDELPSLDELNFAEGLLKMGEEPEEEAQEEEDKPKPPPGPPPKKARTEPVKAVAKAGNQPVKAVAKAGNQPVKAVAKAGQKPANVVATKEAVKAVPKAGAGKSKDPPAHKKAATLEAPEDENWDSEEVSADGAKKADIEESDDIFEKFDIAEEAKGEDHEEKLLVRLRKDFQQLWPGEGQYELEAFGSYVTGLSLQEGDSTGRSDLDCVLLFHGKEPDSWNNNVRSTVVQPTITRLGKWLADQPGLTVTNVITGARVPIVMFDTKELSVDVSVQSPYGPMNSWHLRDLCDSGWPGRLRSLVKLVKKWAKTKGIHTAKDGGLSSYGWAMCAASYLQSVSILPALLPESGSSGNPYIGPAECLEEVLRVGSEGPDGDRQSKFWKAPEPLEVDTASELAEYTPEDLFTGFIDWMANTVLGHMKNANKAQNSPWLPLEQRHIVSVRPRTQKDLAMDVAWCEKYDEHWSPQRKEVHMLIEEPMTGENVSRAVRKEGFQAIHQEIKRAQEYLGVEGKLIGQNLKSLLKEPPVNKRAAGWQKPGKGQGNKRPAPADFDIPPGKRRSITAEPILGTVMDWKGKFGWIKAAQEVEGMRKDGLIYAALEDTVDWQPLRKAAQVMFTVYADSKGIGAENVSMLGEAEAAEAAEKIAKMEADDATKIKPWKPSHGWPGAAGKGAKGAGAAGKGAGGKGAKGAKGAKGKEGMAEAFQAMMASWWGQQWGEQMPEQAAQQEEAADATSDATAKAPENGAAQKPGGAKKRQRVTEDLIGGTVLEWKGAFGWIEPFEEIDHPAASKRGGKVYLARREIKTGETELNPGDMVQFHVFADGSGVGAEEVEVVK